MLWLLSLSPPYPAFHFKLFCSFCPRLQIFGHFTGGQSSDSPIEYKASIIAAITNLKDRNGSSRQAIKKQIEEANPGKKFANGTFLKTLKDMVAAGDLVPVKQHYKLSTGLKKSLVVSQSALLYRSRCFSF